MRSHQTKWAHYDAADRIADEYIGKNSFVITNDPLPDIKHAFFNGFLEGGEQSYALGVEAGKRDAHGKWLPHKESAPIAQGIYLVYRPSEAVQHTIEHTEVIVAKQRGSTIETWYLPLPVPYVK